MCTTNPRATTKIIPQRVIANKTIKEIWIKKCSNQNKAGKEETIIKEHMEQTKKTNIVRWFI